MRLRYKARRAACQRPPDGADVILEIAATVEAILKRRVPELAADDPARQRLADSYALIRRSLADQSEPALH